MPVDTQVAERVLFSCFQNRLCISSIYLCKYAFFFSLNLEENFKSSLAQQVLG